MEHVLIFCYTTIHYIAYEWMYYRRFFCLDLLYTNLNAIGQTTRCVVQYNVAENTNPNGALHQLRTGGS